MASHGRSYPNNSENAQNNRQNGGGRGGNMHSDQDTKIVLIGASLEMENEGIRKWCSQYGTVVEVRSTKVQLNSGDVKYFFVDYSSFAEADKAMRSINLSNPFNVECQFSRKKQKNQNNRNNDQYTSNNRNESSNNQSNRYNNNYGHGDGIGNNTMSNSTRNDGIKNYSEGQGGNSRPMNNRENTNNYKKPDPVESVPKKFSELPPQPRQQTSLNPPKWNHTKPPTGDIENKEKKLTVATQNFKEPPPSHSTVGMETTPVTVPAKKGTCLNCAKESRFLCERCKCFYCSHECQLADWPFHKTVCNVIPQLIPVNSNDTNIPHTISKPLTESKQQQQPVNKTPPKVTANHTSSPPQVIALTTTLTSKTITPPVGHNKTETKTIPEVNRNNEKENDVSKNYHKKLNDFDRALANTSSGIEFTAKQITQNIPTRLPAPAEVPKKPSFMFGDFPKNRTPIFITSVISPDVVYIRSSDVKENASYCKLLQDVHFYGLEAKTLHQLPNVGDFVLTDYQSLYSRALILKVNSRQEIHIAYLDFGNVDVKKLDELKTIGMELQRIPRYAFRVLLKNVIKSSMPEEGVKYLNQLCNDVVELELRYESTEIADNSKKCELFDAVGNVTINNKLNELMGIRPPTENDRILMIDDIKIRTIPPGKKVKALVRDNSLLKVGCVSLATPECDFEMTPLEKELNKYCNAQSNNKPYTPRLNEACLVFMENENLWFRAICIETVGNGSPKMQLIDVGSFVDINIKYIQRMPEKLAAVPCCAIQAYIKNIPYTLSPEQMKKLEQYFPKGEFIVLDEVELDNGNPEEGEQNNVITVNELIDYFIS